MNIEQVLPLGSAKFPIERVPTLLDSLKKQRDEINDATHGAKPNARAAWNEFLGASEGVVTQLSVSGGAITLVDQDLDSVGYALISALEAKARAFSSVGVPLLPHEQSLADDAKILARELFEEQGGTKLFKRNYVAEYNGVRLILEKAKQPNHAARVTRLGLNLEFARLERCHTRFGELLGITAEDKEVSIVARFQSAAIQLVAAIVIDYGAITDAKWRERLAGPFARHIEDYRQEQRRIRSARNTRPNPIITQPAAADDAGL
jgi:hypothetical protein